MYEYYEHYKKARDAGDVDKSERWARQLIWEVARHAVGEEIVVYPLMEHHMGEEGKRLADEDREAHTVRASSSIPSVFRSSFSPIFSPSSSSIFLQT